MVKTPAYVWQSDCHVLKVACVFYVTCIIIPLIHLPRPPLPQPHPVHLLQAMARDSSEPLTVHLDEITPAGKGKGSPVFWRHRERDAGRGERLENGMHVIKEGFATECPPGELSCLPSFAFKIRITQVPQLELAGLAHIGWVEWDDTVRALPGEVAFV